MRVVVDWWCNKRTARADASLAASDITGIFSTGWPVMLHKRVARVVWRHWYWYNNNQWDEITIAGVINNNVILAIISNNTTVLLWRSSWQRQNNNNQNSCTKITSFYHAYNSIFMLCLALAIGCCCTTLHPEFWIDWDYYVSGQSCAVACSVGQDLACQPSFSTVIQITWNQRRFLSLWYLDHLLYRRTLIRI